MKKLIVSLLIGLFVLSALSVHAGGDKNHGDKGKGSVIRNGAPND
ncbi:MAG: hypothetical protein RBU23_02865 [Candidatus Auribacterota bacterium]|jgi:hypothetical protein|nr:hypothetical protein [Candidatus Auribacterota bacterium]